jgi:ABC-type branched-subunit amino acid transport system substrate-binding protein
MSMNSRMVLYGTRRRIVATIVCALPGLAVSARAQTSTSHLRIGVVIPSGALTADERSTIAGIRLGAAEAKQTARLFGADVQVFEANGNGKTHSALSAASFLSSGRQVQILIAVSAAAADTVAKFAEEHHTIFLNVGSRSDALRSACRRYTFHVEGSATMYANARLFAPRQAGAMRASPASSDSIVLWHQLLERFGASQLNDRYRGVARSGMDGAAWAGWMAVKTVAEAALRTKSNNAAQLLGYLESPTTQLDGHKGWPLSFRASDHQLRQPLYIVVASSGTGARVVDVPDLRTLNSGSVTSNANAVLDRLSAGRITHCQWKQ